MPKVSFILPNKNHSKYLRKSLGNLVAQTNPAEEIIVYDDGSDDDSVAVIEEIASANPVIQFIQRDQSLGTIKNLNAGLELAKGECINFAAADDFVCPEFLEESLYWLDRFPQAAFVTACVEISNDDDDNIGIRPVILPSIQPGYISPEDVRDILDWGDNFFLGTVAVYRTALVRKHGGFDSMLLSLTDSFLARRLALEYGFCFIPKKLGVWRIHKKNYSIKMNTSDSTLDDMVKNSGEIINNSPSGLFPLGYHEKLTRRLQFGAGRLLANDIGSNNETVLQQMVSLAGGKQVDACFFSIAKKLGRLSSTLSVFWLLIRLRPFSLFRLFIEPIRRTYALNSYKFFFKKKPLV